MRRLTGPLADLGVPSRESHRSEVAPLDAEDREVDVVLDAEPEEEPGLLVRAGQTELGTSTRGLAGDVPAEELDPAGRRWEITRYDVEECRLPRAVRPEDRAAFAGYDIEIDLA